MTKKAVSAVIFDLDGTLLNSLEDLADSMNAALDAMGLPGHSPAEYRFMVGDGVTALVKRALPNGSSQEAVERCVAKMKEEYAERWDRKTQPYPGVTELLDRLAAENLPMNILSNKMADFTQLMVKRFLSAWTFHSVVGLNEHVPRKPDPKGALRIAESNGIPAEQFIFIGDTNTDMRTACAAGMIPLGVEWGFRTRDELLKSGAVEVVSRPQDLLDWITIK